MANASNGNAYIPGGGSGGAAISAGAGSQNTGTVVFSNSNGVSFGLNNGVITASVTPGAAAGIGAMQAGTQTQTSGTAVFANSNNITFGMSGSSQITASFSTNIGIAAVGAGTQTGTSGTAVFANSNGVTFGMSGSSQITASYNSTSAAGLGTTFAGTNVSASMTLNTAGLNVALSAGGGGHALSAGTQSGSTGTFVFSNSNGVSFGMSGSSQITASVGAQTNQTIGLYASSQTVGQSSSSTVDARSVSFVGQGIVSVGNSAGSFLISASTAAQTNQSIGIYGSSQTIGQSSSTTVDARSLTLVGQGAISIGASAGSILISAAAGAQSNQTLGLYASSNTTGQSSSGTVDARSLTFVGAGAISVGLSGGSYLISSPATTGVTMLSAGVSTGGNTSGNTGTVTGLMLLAGGNNITLSGSTNGSSITVTISAGAGGGGVAVSAGTQSVSTGTVVYSNSNNVSFGMSNSSVITASASYSQISSIGLYAVGNTTQNSSTTLDQRTLSFDALGAMTVGYSNGSIQLSAPATSSLSATGAVSISTNGSTISIGAPSYGTLSYWDNDVSQASLAATQLGLGSVYLQQMSMPANMSASAARIFASGSFSSSSNSSYAGTISIQAALYTKNGSSLSLASSGSQSFAFTNTSNNSTASLSGLRGLTVPLNANMTPGNYWVAIWSSTASANANWFTLSNVYQSAGGVSFSGAFGAAANASNQLALGQGVWSTTSANLPSSIAFSHVTGTGANSQPLINLYNASA